MRSNDPLGGPRWRSRSRTSYSLAVARIEAELSVAVAAADNVTNAGTAGNNGIGHQAQPAANNTRVRACGVVGATTHGTATEDGGRSGGSHRRSRSINSYSLAVARIEAELSVAVAAADNATGAGTGNNNINEAQQPAANNNSRARAFGVLGATTYGEATDGEGDRRSAVAHAQLGSRIHAPVARELSGEEILLPSSSAAPRLGRRPIDAATGEQPAR